jgi:hypothetical protein
MCYNLKVVIIWHLRVFPRLEIPNSAFYQKEVLSVKHADLRDMFAKTPMSVCASTIVVLPVSLSPTLTSSSGMRTPENTEKDLVDPETADEMYFSCD